MKFAPSILTLSACAAICCAATVGQRQDGDVSLEMMERRAVPGSVAFFETRETYDVGNSTRISHSCGIIVDNVGGWTGTIGPWFEPCDEIRTLDGKWKVTDDDETTIVVIDPATKTLELTHSLSNSSYQCELTGYANGDGCNHKGFLDTSSELAKRICCQPHCTTTKTTVPAANGENPQPYVKHRKLSTNIVCRTSSCNVGATNSKTYTEGYTYTFTPFQWISAGYSVSKAVSTGTTLGCTVKYGHTGCIWKATPFIEYGGRNKVISSCPPYPPQYTYSPLRIRSPRTAGGGPDICLNDGDCAFPQGHVYWVKG